MSINVFEDLQQIAIERATKLANFFQIQTTMMEPTQSIIISYLSDDATEIARSRVAAVLAPVERRISALLD